MDGDDLELFSRSLRHAVESAPDAAALDAALAELGWTEALDESPRAAISTLFGIQGETNATSSALARLMAWAMTGSPEAPGALLPKLGTCSPPGRKTNGAITVQGMANAPLVAGSTGALTVAVPRSDGGVDAVTVPLEDLDLHPVIGLDPGASLVRVNGSASVSTGSAEVDWDRAVRLGRLAVSHELVGAARSVLAQAREHALERIQFGQPIARFQAVRHKLAEILISIETAEALVDAAWRDETSLSASMAVSASGRAARLAAKNGQQVLAGIGFTEEHGLHRWIRRILVLDEVLGSSRTLTKDLGVELLASRRLPPLLPL